jgi:hypothetical protein
MSRRDDHHRRRALIHDSRACIASAHQVVDQAQRPMARQQYLKVVCAWCTRTIRWQRREGAVPGEVSHGSCRACAAVVFRELHARQPRADSGVASPDSQGQPAAGLLRCSPGTGTVPHT